MATKWVYLFSEGNRDMRDLLGGKGAGVAEMTKAGMPVPPGFTITTAACNAYTAAGKKFPEGMWEQALAALAAVEKQTGKKFGSADNPLLVSVRSGAKFSMPGMMDTVLNLGLNEETLKGLVSLSGDERFGYDAYRRFIQMFGRIVMGIEGAKFEHILDKYKTQTKGGKDTDLTVAMLKDIVKEYKAVYKQETGHDFPTDPHEQLKYAIGAVFGSWMGRRAVDYRRINKIPDDLGTAVNVQTMVFGNLGEGSGTGVAFTRNPSTGERALYGEFLQNAQGEDVVAGIRTPMKIAEMKNLWPEIYKQFETIAGRLEGHYKEMQDMEFTIERGTLYMLQTRTGKRTAAAAVKIAVDMVKESLIAKNDALLRVEPSQVNQLLLPRLDPDDKAKAVKENRLLARGLNASPGAGVGVAVFDADRAVEAAKQGPVVLVRYETSPDDVHGMYASKGILTQHGGATSHAAVVARGAGLPCVAGCESLHVDEAAATFTVRVDGKTLTVKEGEHISIDGSTGEVFAGQIKRVDPDFEKEVDLKTLLEWADETKRLGVWANGDYPRDAVNARKFGAKGIGLCRTEHMFFETERLPIVQRMILAKTVEERKAALDELLPIQRNDFIGILRAMSPYPVIIRLIDPPLHEFLPNPEELMLEVTGLRIAATAAKGEDALDKMLSEKEEMLKAVQGMREANPMMGLRGCRLGITMPEITEMQVRAILEAACILKKEGVDVHPEVMIPLVGHVNELKNQMDALLKVAKDVLAEQAVKLDYKFGTMIEVPRGALTADQIAEYAEFFSFGTNDLTQMTFGFSRDDAEGAFLLKYVENKILPFNPFQTIDRDGVGQLMKIAVTKGRAKRPGLEVGICGEHGGDPESIALCHELGLNYVSCSPFRVPVARLAAAQAALTKTEKDK